MVDMRATLRATLRSGGVIPLKRRDHRRRRPPLVVLCDISGSMSAYARMFLHFLHALTNDRDRVHVFLFGTRLTNVTRELKHREVDEALARVAARVEDWDGGTRSAKRCTASMSIGPAACWGKARPCCCDGQPRPGCRRRRRTRNCPPPPPRAPMPWLNPLLRYDRFEPKALGVRACCLMSTSSAPSTTSPRSPLWSKPSPMPISTRHRKRAA